MTALPCSVRPLVGAALLVFAGLTCASRAGAEPPSAKEATPRAEPDPTAAPRRIRYAIEGVELRGNERTSARVVFRYVPFHAGDILDVDDPRITLTRYRLLGTGYFNKVDLSLRKGSARGRAVLVIDVVERNTFVLQSISLGIAADEDTAGNAKPISPYVGLQVAETNLAGSGISLGAGLALASDQLALQTSVYDPAFIGSSWSVGASLMYTSALDFFGNRAVAFESPALEQREVTDYAVIAYKRFGGTLGVGRDISIASSFQLDYHLEQVDATVPIAASHMRGDRREPIDFSVLDGKSLLSRVRARVRYDTRDTPLLTTRGALATIAIGVAAEPLGSDYDYQKAELSLSHWFRLPRDHVLSLSAFAGAIAGRAPFFERFYVGDFSDFLPDRVLGLSPDHRRSLNILGTDIAEVRYGDYAASLSAEYRIPLYRGHGSVYGIDIFASAGIFGVASHADVTQPPSGYTGLARIPIDLTGNFGVRVDTSVGGLNFAFSNLVGFVPARRGSYR